MKCIILDGWHKGEMFSRPDAAPEIKLLRPAHTIICDCDPESQEYFEQDATTETYALAFRSIDGQTALYSKSGNSDAAWRNIGNLIRRERPIGLHTVIDCHDEQAWE